MVGKYLLNFNKEINNNDSEDVDFQASSLALRICSLKGTSRYW